MRKDTVARAIWFTAPNTVEIIDEREIPSPIEEAEALSSKLYEDEVKIRSICSGISAGTEMLLYRGRVPQNVVLDNWGDNHGDSLIRYPVKYGYCNVGQVVEVGPACKERKVGDVVFTFHPHETLFTAKEPLCTLIPKEIEPRLAVFLANMETAVGIVHDSEARLGETVAVFGLGVVGLLVTGLLKRKTGVRRVLGVDPIASRRKIAEEQMGAHATFPSPSSQEDARDLLLESCADTVDGRPDLIIEVSGSPNALQQAIYLAGRESRIVVGSWYGDKEVVLNLGRTFHRNRVRIVSSQVSHINPALTGRWDKQRRLGLALSLLKEIPVSSLITDVVSFESAADAYRKISSRPDETLQVILDYT